jgi:Pentapeptide repeats (8 copies)
MTSRGQDIPHRGMSGSQHKLGILATLSLQCGTLPMRSAKGGTMENPEDIILRGASEWNRWHREHPTEASFAHPNWYDSRSLGGMQVKGRNHLDFSGMDLSGAQVIGAFAEGLNLRGCVCENTVFEEGDFSRADFSRATFWNTRFNKTILTNATITGATFRNCNLNRVNLVGADFRVHEISETVVYGVSAWDLTIDENSAQNKLMVEKTYDLYSDLIARQIVPVTVDNIELAEFIYFLTNYKRIRDAINILNDRGVLLLGRFRNGGLERLNMIREHLQARGYLAMIFDFERPGALDLKETVVTMAGLSKFVIADLSGPRVPGELTSIVQSFDIPILAIGEPAALPRDLGRSARVIELEASNTELLDRIDEKVPDLEALHRQRILELARAGGGLLRLGAR